MTSLCCPRCGNDLFQDDLVCPECGTARSPVETEKAQAIRDRIGQDLISAGLVGTGILVAPVLAKEVIEDGLDSLGLLGGSTPPDGG